MAGGAVVKNWGSDARNPVTSSVTASSGSGVGQGLINAITQYLDPAKQSAALDQWQAGQQGVLDKQNQANIQRVIASRGLSADDPYVMKLAGELAAPGQAALSQQRLVGEDSYKRGLVSLLPSLYNMSGSSSGGGGGRRSGGGGPSGNVGPYAGGGGGGGGERGPYDPSVLGGMIGSGYALASNIIGSPNPSTFQWGSGQHIGETYGEMTGQGPRASGDPQGNAQRQYERGNALGHTAAGYSNGLGGAPDPRSTMQPTPATPGTPPPATPPPGQVPKR